MVDLLGQPCQAERAPCEARLLSLWWPQRECAAALRWSHGTPSALSRTASLVSGGPVLSWTMPRTRNNDLTSSSSPATE